MNKENSRRLLDAFGFEETDKAFELLRGSSGVADYTSRLREGSVRLQQPHQFVIHPHPILLPLLRALVSTINSGREVHPNSERLLISTPKERVTLRL